jgi:hypothetical protein
VKVCCDLEQSPVILYVIKMRITSYKRKFKDMTKTEEESFFTCVDFLESNKSFAEGMLLEYPP